MSAEKLEHLDRDESNKDKMDGKLQAEKCNQINENLLPFSEQNVQVERRTY